MNSLDIGKNPPGWLVQLIYRLFMLRAPGVYEMLFIVEDDGRRRVVFKNPRQPYRIEGLNDDGQCQPR